MSEPTVEDLTDEQLDALRLKLEALRDELAADIEDARTSSKPVQLDQAAVGRLSRMDSIQQQQMAAAHRRRLEIRLQQVKAALHAMDRGDYGYCNICEEPLTLRRLEVRPESPICVACQSLNE